MRVLYRTFDIDVHRDRCMAGYDLLYYSVFRSDGYELESGYSDSSDTPRTYINLFKERVDSYIAHPSEEERGGWEFGDPIDCPYCGRESKGMQVIDIDAPRVDRRSMKVIIEGMYMALQCPKCKHIATHLGTFEMNDEGRDEKNFYPCICAYCIAPRVEKRLAKAVVA